MNEPGAMGKIEALRENPFPVPFFVTTNPTWIGTELGSPRLQAGATDLAD